MKDYSIVERLLTVRQRHMLVELGCGNWHDYEINGNERRVMKNLLKHKLVAIVDGIWKATKGGIIFADWYVLKTLGAEKKKKETP